MAQREQMWHQRLNATSHLLENLNPEFTYFTVMEQSHEKAFDNQGPDTEMGKLWNQSWITFDHARWDKVVVFDSRGADPLSSVDVGRRPVVPIPLLHSKELQSWEEKKEQVFFAGACHHELRRAFGPHLTVPPGPVPGGRYAWDIRACNEEMPYDDFARTLQESTWIIAPIGSMPPTFMTYEALQAGSLPLIPFVNWSGPVEPQVWLPYQDIGVRWNEFALFVHEANLTSLKQTVEAIPTQDVKKRLAIVKKLRPLFTADGLNTYIIYTVSRLRRERMNRSKWMEMYSAGRAIDLHKGPQLLDSKSEFTEMEPTDQVMTTTELEMTTSEMETNDQQLTTTEVEMTNTE